MYEIDRKFDFSLSLKTLYLKDGAQFLQYCLLQVDTFYSSLPILGT
jgi:hypothetical protein